MSGRLLAEDSSDEDDFDDGEYEASVAANARLGSLFAHSNVAEENSGFVYKAPKPPVVARTDVSETPAKTTEDDNVAVKVLYAVPAHVFLLQNGQYVPQGKLGLAILGNRVKKDYKILIYMHNKQPVSQASLKFESQIFVQKNNYVQFLDDKQQFWSVAFDAEVHLMDFLKWYLASKAVLINDKHKEVFVVDVLEGDGESVGYGDSVEMEYVEYLVEDGPQLTEFNGSNSSRPLRLKIGKGKVPKGWEDGLVGMKRFGKRLFIIPPDLGYANRDKNATFPTNVPIMVYVLIKRVKYSSRDKNATEAERKASSDSVLSKKSDNIIIPESSLERDTLREESTTSSGGEPLAEIFKTESESSESEPASRKADLLSRMAKIGQPMMPFVNKIMPPEEVTTNDTVVPTVDQLQQQKPPVKPRQISHELAVVCVDLTLARPTVTQTMAGGVMKSQSESTISQRAQGVTVPNVVEQQYLPQVSSMQMSNAPYMFPYHMPYHPYQFLMPPTSGVATGLGTPFSVTPDFPASSTSSLERQNTMIIDEIQKSHSQLQDALTKLLSDTLSNINRKVIDINGNLDLKLNKLQTSLVSTSNNVTDENVGMNNDLLVNKLDNLECLVKSISDKALAEDTSSTNFLVMEEKLQSCTDQLKSMQISINELRQALANDSNQTTVAEKLVKIDERLTILQNLKDKLDTVQGELHSNQEWNKKYEKLKSQALIIKEKYEERINLLTEHLHRLQQQLETTKNEKALVVDEQRVKKIMNNLYKTVSSKFLPHGSYLGDDVRKVVLDTIKECTLNALANKVEQIDKPIVGQSRNDDDDKSSSLVVDAVKISLEQNSVAAEASSSSFPAETSSQVLHPPLQTKAKLLADKSESEDQEFYDASYSTPPRFIEKYTKRETTPQTETTDKNGEILAKQDNVSVLLLKKEDDSTLVSEKYTFPTFPLIETVPPPLPEMEDA